MPRSSPIRSPRTRCSAMAKQDAATSWECALAFDGCPDPNGTIRMRIVDFRITRFQFARDRDIGDSQVRADDVNVAAIELIDGQGRIGLGFVPSLFFPLPCEEELTRVFRAESWPGLQGQTAGALAHRVTRSRGGNIRRLSIPFEEAL